MRILGAVALALCACGGAARRPATAAMRPTTAPAPSAMPAEADVGPRPDCSEDVARAPLDQVRALVEAEGCNGHAWHELVTTPLMRAAQVGDADLVAYLIEAGAAIDFRAPSGSASVIRTTALWLAVEAEHPEVVALLLAAGADPNVESEDGVPALFVAASHHDLDTTRMLVDAGADLARVVSADRFTQDQIDSLLWEASHRPAADATTDERVAFLTEVVTRARLARAREAAIEELAVLGAAATAAVPALIDVVLGERLAATDWSAVLAADAIAQIGWTADLDRALPALLEAIPGAPNQARIALVELIATKGPTSKAVLTALRRLRDHGPDQELGTRALEIVHGRTAP